jgi:hypothetical protein
MADFGDGKLANVLIQEPFHSSLGSAKIHDILRHCTMRLRLGSATPLDNRLIAQAARHFAHVGHCARCVRREIKPNRKKANVGGVEPGALAD